MAKISKLPIYPPDLTIDPKDYLVGTDWNDNKKTKSFMIGDLGVALGRAGVKVMEIYLGFCPFATSVVPLADQINTFLSLHSIDVEFNTLVIFKVLHHDVVAPDGVDPHILPTQTNYYFPFGYGSYDPISETCGFADLIIDYEGKVPLTADDITNSPDAEVIDLQDISLNLDTQTLAEYLNTNGDLYDFSSPDKTYYFRFTNDGIDYLYVFNANSSVNGYGVYGDGELQFAEDELLFIFSSGMDYTVFEPTYGVPFKKYTIYKDAANNDPANIDVIELNDIIAGRWCNDDYDDFENTGIVIRNGKYCVLQYLGGSEAIFPNYLIIFIQP